jgi:ornithine cyclodeaminase/alanine dehydrogenase-like protein (mu-crystallin family)
LRIISNEDLEGLLPMPDVVDVLREAYRELARSEVAYVPLISIFAPTQRDDDYFRCSAINGSSAQFRVAAIRIKSDIVSWPSGTKEQKYAGAPGTFCGLILLLSTDDARPLAIIQDGVIQHMRVGAAGAIGVDVMARTDATTLGMLGSGGMARSFLEAIAHVRPLSRVTAYSPTRKNLEAYCAEMTELVGVEVTPVDRAEEAVRGSDIVVSATNSLHPTMSADWIDRGAHVTCVQRRELEAGVYERAARVAQLGHSSMPREAKIPGMQRVKGGFSAYLAGSPDQQARVPRGGDSSAQSYPTIAEIIDAGRAGTGSAEDVSLFLPIGTQGLQFAAVGGLALARCETAGRGQVLPSEWFLENIRN